MRIYQYLYANRSISVRTKETEGDRGKKNKWNAAIIRNISLYWVCHASKGRFSSVLVRDSLSSSSSFSFSHLPPLYQSFRTLNRSSGTFIDTRVIGAFQQKAHTRTVKRNVFGLNDAHTKHLFSCSYLECKWKCAICLRSLLLLLLLLWFRMELINRHCLCRFGYSVNWYCEYVQTFDGRTRRHGLSLMWIR